MTCADLSILWGDGAFASTLIVVVSASQKRSESHRGYRCDSDRHLGVTQTVLAVSGVAKKRKGAMSVEWT